MFDYRLIDWAKGDYDKYLKLYCLIHEQSHIRDSESNVGYDIFSMKRHTIFSPICWKYHLKYLEQNMDQQIDYLNKLISAKSCIQFIVDRCVEKNNIDVRKKRMIHCVIWINLFCTVIFAALPLLFLMYYYCLWLCLLNYVLYLGLIYVVTKSWNLFIKKESTYWNYSHIFTKKEIEVKQSIENMLNDNVLEIGCILLGNNIFPENISMIIVTFLYNDYDETKNLERIEYQKNNAYRFWGRWEPYHDMDYFD